jgi:hypothetical protein
MIWMDYNIEQCGDSFTIKGDWPGEVYQDKDGNPKAQPLYKPGDVFVVDSDGWLRKTDQLELFLKKKTT